MLSIGNFKHSPDDSNVPSMLATTDFRSNFFQVQKWQYHSSERADVSKEEEGNEKEAGDLPGNSWPGGSDGKEYTCNAGDTGSILGHN